MHNGVGDGLRVCCITALVGNVGNLPSVQTDHNVKAFFCTSEECILIILIVMQHFSVFLAENILAC